MSQKITGRIVKRLKKPSLHKKELAGIREGQDAEKDVKTDFVVHSFTDNQPSSVFCKISVGFLCGGRASLLKLLHPFKFNNLIRLYFKSDTEMKIHPDVFYSSGLFVLPVFLSSSILIKGSFL